MSGLILISFNLVMKKNSKYETPVTEIVTIVNDESIAQMTIPISGGTTPEESDAKPFGGWSSADEEEDDGGILYQRWGD